MPVGPQLPSSMLEKRKRDAEDDGSGSDSDTGPAPPLSGEVVTKKARVVGPTLPPAPLNEKPLGNPPNISDDASDSSDDDDDDDDFGPSLPPVSSSAANAAVGVSKAVHTVPPVEVIQPKRDDWMMVPPSGDDWSSRADPTKLKNRKFNTGKGAKKVPSGADDSSTWHETPAEKQARLQREMMGIKDTASRPSTTRQSTSHDENAETAKRMQEYNKSRGPTLYQAHQKQGSVEKEDDASARAFDREKDIGGGMQINATQRRDMLKKAADFGSRFSSAKYL